MDNVYAWLIGFFLIIVTIGPIFYFRKRNRCIKGKPSGIKNDSSECYMSSIIQAVASSDELIKQYKKIHENYPNIESLKYFVMLLQNVNKFDDSKEQLIKNTELLNNLIESANLKNSSQQDAFELLSTLIKEIHKDLKKFILENKQTMDPKTKETLQIELPMKLKIAHQMKGINLQNKTNDQIGLSVELNEECKTKPGDTIENLIKQYFQPTIIDEDPDKKTQKFLCDKAPDILLLHILANKWNNEENKMVKQEYYITYDEKITCCFDIFKELNEKIEQTIVNYKIKAVVEHIDRKHVTYRKLGNKWFSVDNELVELAEFKNDICPYIMIYEKC